MRDKREYRVARAGNTKAANETAERALSTSFTALILAARTPPGRAVSWERSRKNRGGSPAFVEGRKRVKSATSRFKGTGDGKGKAT